MITIEVTETQIERYVSDMMLELGVPVGLGLPSGKLTPSSRWYSFSSPNLFLRFSQISSAKGTQSFFICARKRSTSSRP